MSELELKPCPYCGSYDVGVNVSPVQTYGLRYYYAICYQCKTTGPEMDNEKGESISEEAVTKAWNALPRSLRWTSEPPTVPGWYWQRGGESEEPRVVPVVWCRADSGEMELRICCRPYTPLSRYEWAGPIPEPQEEKK